MLMVLGKKKMKILEISQDKSSIDDKVRNGIFKVKIEFPLDSFNDICYFAGLHWIDGLSALFQLSGTPPKCLFCERFGHIKRNCPKLKMVCQKCNKRGHLAADCNLVKAMFGNNDLEDEHDEALILNLNSSVFNNDNPFLVPGATASAFQARPGAAAQPGAVAQPAAAQTSAAPTTVTTTVPAKKTRTRNNSTSSNRSNASNKSGSGKQPLTDEEKAVSTQQKLDAKSEKDRLARQTKMDQLKTRQAEELKTTNEAALAASASSKKKSNHSSSASSLHTYANSNFISNPDLIQMDEDVD
jgi:hypothetical protein